MDNVCSQRQVIQTPTKKKKTMGYLVNSESEVRLGKVKSILERMDLDLALVYYDEFNIGNGWYLTGWCPQFESGAVLVPRKGTPLLLGGPESEPFAKLDSTITETRNFPVFMVPNEEYPAATIIDFPKLFQEVIQMVGQVKRIGIVGGDRMPAGCFKGILDGFQGVEVVDITAEYTALRYFKSGWEIDQIRAAFALSDFSYDAMKSQVAAGNSEIQIAAAGEFAARIHDREATGLGLCHHQQRFFYRKLFPGDGVAVAAAHDVAHFEQQGPANGAARMIFGKILLLETARL